MAVPDRTTRTGPPEPTPMVRSDTDHVEACTHIGSPVDNSGKTTRGTDDFRDDEVDGKSEGRFSVRDVASPGEYVAGGRYRLLLFHGGPEGLQFWQATDTALGRQVALTLVGPQFGSSGEYVREVLARTLRLSRLDTPGIARVLQVTRTGPSAVVASEWVRGGSLREVADTAPSSTGAARAMQSLAEAAVAAHRAGLALSIDHPDRIRVSVDGDVTLAFPATLPDATPEDDVRGCGAVLLRVALQTMAVARNWHRQRIGARGARNPSPAKGTEHHRPGHTFRDRRRSRGLAAATRRNSKRHNTFKDAAAGRRERHYRTGLACSAVRLGPAAPVDSGSMARPAANRSGR